TAASRAAISILHEAGRVTGDGAGRLRPRIEPPLGLVLATAALTLLILAGETVLGAREVGLYIDDYVHVSRFQEWLNEGWYVPSYGPAAPPLGEEPQPGTLSSPFVYGPAFSALAHLVNVALGNEAMNEISTAADAYQVRHLVVALLGLATVACAGVAVRVLTRDLLAAIWGAAALLAIPVWAGQSMFNIKDIPVASGFTFVTVGLVLGLASARRDSWPSPGRLLAVSALVGFGVMIGVGTRSAMWVPFACSLSAFAALSWLVLRSRADVLRSLAAPGVGFVVGLVVVTALHPYPPASPIEWMIESVSESSGYDPPSPPTLTVGRLLSPTDPPVWYLPAWLFAGVPVIIFGLAGVGTALVIRSAARWRRSETGAEAPSRLQIGGMLLVTLQLALLPAASIVAGSTMYSGLRLHLYVLPAVAILAGIGAAKLIRATGGKRSSPRLRWAAALVLAVALAVPTVEQTRLYPYNYIYVNPLAGLGGVEGRWETDQLYVGSREAFRRVPPSVTPLCSYGLIIPSSPSSTIIHTCGLNHALVEPFRDELGEDATATPIAGEVWIVGRPRAGNHPPHYCREDDNVTRPLRTEEIVVAHVLRCVPP
ncbi:MAG TPA: hypothetical protein VK920_03550, partial [Solirubrobacterales bacterium]|nr:hypothetical protein [Solirubrobacterales bacterium]